MYHFAESSEFGKDAVPLLTVGRTKATDTNSDAEITLTVFSSLSRYPNLKVLSFVGFILFKPCTAA